MSVKRDLLPIVEQGSVDDDLVLSGFLPYRIVSLGHLISQKLSATYAAEKISIPEWRVLAVIAQRQEMAARDVVLMTPIDKMAVSRASKNLEAKNLIARRLQEKDKRVGLLSLTLRGRRVYNRIAQSALSFEKEVLSSLSEEEAENFGLLMKKLEAQLIGNGKSK